MSNPAGKTEFTINLQVQTPPLIAPAQSSFNTVLGDTVIMECNVEAEPPAIIDVSFFKIKRKVFF